MKKTIFVLAIAIITLLSACGYTQDDLDRASAAGYESGYDNGFEDGYDEGYDEGYEIGYKKGYHALKPISLPTSGTILAGKEYSGSEITVTADWGSSYVVSLKSITGALRLAFFVRSGETVTVGVPDEYLYVYFASGDNWYGYSKGFMFGEDTVYSKDDTALDFKNYTWEYTLKPVYDGNFTEDPSNENEFFE